MQERHSNVYLLNVLRLGQATESISWKELYFAKLQQFYCLRYIVLLPSDKRNRLLYRLYIWYCEILLFYSQRHMRGPHHSIYIYILSPLILSSRDESILQGTSEDSRDIDEEMSKYVLSWDDNIRKLICTMIFLCLFLY